MIGVYGGTFDPVHFGHLRTAWEVADRLALDEVRMVPARHPPHRPPPVAGPGQRRDMLALALVGQERLRLDETELERPGPSWMVDTLECLRARVGDVPLVLVLGEDAFAGLPRWRAPRRILDLAHLAVMTRPGSAPPSRGQVADWYQARRAESVDELRRSPGGRILRCPVTLLDISGTRIRELIGRGREPRYLLPEAVWRYIQEKGLYGWPPAQGGRERECTNGK
ncbi:MAG: nicotinate-nucleotide adenylyltransferase [Gammaproteobacteria bacterium]|nr:MAG: nicotinate-nucleotide adenylyltransferase [Gammaproteobacteria bacterium]